MNFLRGSTLETSDYSSSQFFSFEQDEVTGMDSKGYAYIPKACEEKECKVHFMLHGCDMQAENIEKSLIQGSQFNEIAEANDIVIIYPQNKDVFLDDL